MIWSRIFGLLTTPIGNFEVDKGGKKRKKNKKEKDREPKEKRLTLQKEKVYKVKGIERLRSKR